MLSGKGAFDGKTQASVIGAIMHGTPRPLSSLQPPIPPALDRIVVRCIAKDPDCRWQTMIDLGAELSWIADGAPPGLVRGPQHPSRLERISWISAAVAMLVAIVLAILLFGRPAEERPVTRLDVVTPPTYDPFAFALSPDGRQLVFAATSETGSKLWRRRLDESIAQPLAGTESASAPFWAPDGRSIGFFADGKLKRLDLDGGAPQILASAPDGRGGAWTRDGMIVYTPTTASPLFRVPASGGTAVALTRLDQTQHVSHRWPQALPDGHLIFFALGFLSSNSGPSGVYLTSLDGGSPQRLIAAESAASYAPPGYLLLVDQGTLIARRVNLRNSSVGPPLPIAQPVAADPTIWRSAFSVSATGVLAHRTIAAARRQLVWADRTGARVDAVGGIDENNQLSPSLSPDGRRIGVQRTAQGAPHTWIFDPGRDVAVRLRDDPAAEGRPVWSPDGRRLAFLTAFQGRQMLIEKPTSGGAADEKILVSSGQGLAPLDWSANGHFLLFSMSEEKTGWDIWALPLTGDGKAFPVVQSPSDEQLGQLSHDGRWIAYQSNESGRTEVYVQPFQRTGAKLAISTGGGIAPRWRRDGHELFYIASDGALMAVPLHNSADGATLEAGAPIRLFRDPIVGGGSMLIGGMQQYAVAPDGQRFLINMAISETTAPPITVVLNWTSALDK
jgi:eukaryotic-like serine/threonine-protein kinase